MKRKFIKVILATVISCISIGSLCFAADSKGETKIQIGQGKDNLTTSEFVLEGSTYVEHGNGTYYTNGFQEYEKGVPYSIFNDNEELGSLVFGKQPSNQGGEYVYHASFTPVVTESPAEEPGTPTEEPGTPATDEPNEPEPIPTVDEPENPPAEEPNIEDEPEISTPINTEDAQKEPEKVTQHEINTHVAPQTGDATNIGLLILLIAVSVGVVIVIKKYFI